MKEPNFFIVGGARCGTTSLWQHLSMQPEVFMPEDEMFKEPAFFSYVGQKRTFDQYVGIFNGSDKNHKWIGEASTVYLTDPQSARRIYDFNKKARIIIMLRNPVYRAYSLYNWMVQDGYEYAESFSKALDLENVRANKKIPNYFEPEYYHNYLYFHSGLFSQQVKRFIDLFDDNVLIIKFEDYIEDFRKVYTEICDFLEITPEFNEIKYTNRSRSVKHSFLQFLLRKFTKFYLSNCREISKISNDKRVFEETLKGQIDKDIRKLNEVVSLNRFRRHEIEKHFHEIIEQLFAQSFIPENQTKNSRDLLMRTGWTNTDVKPLKEKIANKLRAKYKNDIMLLSENSGIDFTTWL